MTKIDYVARLNVSIGRTILVVFAVVLMTGCASLVSTEKVTLKDGKTYEVETVRGLPVGFANDQITVHDLGITALFRLEQADAPPYVWRLVAELTEKGRFAVTVTTPLDRAALTTFEVVGPSRVIQQFFPQAAYPQIWQGIDQRGTHWFPFHFVFEDKESGKRFQFTQWAQIGDRTMSEMRALIEKVEEKLRQRGSR